MKVYFFFRILVIFFFKTSGKIHRNLLNFKKIKKYKYQKKHPKIQYFKKVVFLDGTYLGDFSQLVSRELNIFPLDFYFSPGRF